jgi:hypothetical protein
VDPYGDLTDGIHPHWLEVCGWGGVGWAAGAACAASSWLYAWVCYLSCLLLNSSPLLASCHRDPASSVDCAPPFGAFCACPQVDRVIAHRTRLGRRSFLVKWRGLGYAESTWESERDLQGEEVGVGWVGGWMGWGARCSPAVQLVDKQRWLLYCWRKASAAHVDCG